MGSSFRFHDIFSAEPQAATGVPFARFMELALYHPTAGYYARAGPRIGRDRRSDFYTATSLGPIFGELVVAASLNLLRAGDPRKFTLVEIGAEPTATETSGNAGGILRGVPHPFAGCRTISLGEPLDLPPRCIVFSNELFDAQPCHRLVGRGGAWRELGVAWRDNKLLEVELPAQTAEVAALAESLPKVAPDGYHLDLPLYSVTLLQQVTAQPWRGLFLAFDYGKSWRELTDATPQGTVRAYSHHRQSGELLAQPGEQDLTCHVCWDWLAGALEEDGFFRPAVESQEAFFTHHASDVLQAVVAEEASRFSARKQALLQLLHPAEMGRKFQVLHALRE